MAAVASALALGTAVLAYLLLEFGQMMELQIPDSINMSELIEAPHRTKDPKSP